MSTCASEILQRNPDTTSNGFKVVYSDNYFADLYEQQIVEEENMGTVDVTIPETVRFYIGKGDEDAIKDPSGTQGKYLWQGSQLSWGQNRYYDSGDV